MQNRLTALLHSSILKRDLVYPPFIITLIMMQYMSMHSWNAIIKWFSNETCLDLDIINLQYLCPETQTTCQAHCTDNNLWQMPQL